ncbi:rod shape-determining protein MreC [Prochlorococcus marinus]|uniref:rod shape-determining protein MreC n=1 Tax=Prochlorococcus marinus TaxID=1219 RepID=UPI0022B4539A|nr:rod shape-determining protein MreC [Prochlorococcus marinus]
MIKTREKIGFQLLLKSKFWVLFVLGCLLFGIRWTKGAGYLDLYSILLKPILPGTAQREWIKEGENIERNIRLQLLEDDNTRLRRALSLKELNDDKRISAAVISRSSRNWWQQLEINKGAKDGVLKGQTVVGPGGLLGLVENITPLTARVRLLTDPGHQVGAWIDRTQQHGILTGMGTNRPKLIFLNKNSLAQIGDAVTTSPASTLLPPNLTIGIVQFVNEKALPSPYAIVQLTASPEAIDWVQILINNGQK